MKDKNDPRWLTKEYKKQQAEYDRQKNTVNPKGYEARGGTAPYLSPPDPGWHLDYMRQKLRNRVDEAERDSIEAQDELQGRQDQVNEAKGTPYYEELKRLMEWSKRTSIRRQQELARLREEYARLPEPPPPPKFADIKQQMIYEQAAARGMQQGFSPETIERALRAGKTLLFPS